MYSDVEKLLNGKRGKKVAKDTYLEFISQDEGIVMLLKGSAVAVFYQDYFRLHSAGQYSPLVLRRLNLAMHIAGLPLSARVHQHNWIWYVTGASWNLGSRFYDGMRIGYDAYR